MSTSTNYPARGLAGAAMGAGQHGVVVVPSAAARGIHTAAAVPDLLRPLPSPPRAMTAQRRRPLCLRGHPRVASHGALLRPGAPGRDRHHLPLRQISKLVTVRDVS